MTPFKQHRIVLLFTSLCLVLVGYAFFEWNASRSIDAISDQSELADSSVDEAGNSFQEFIFDFSKNSTAFTKSIETKILSTNTINESLLIENREFDFWGVGVYKNNQLVAWNGFVPDTLTIDSLANRKNSYISIESSNNVTYLFSRAPLFVLEDSVESRYDVYTRVRLSQENILTLGKDLELDTKSLLNLSSDFPIRFQFENFFNDNTLAAAWITTPGTDSVAIINTRSSDFDTFFDSQKEKVSVWRALFFILFLFVSGALVYFYSLNLTELPRILVQLLAYSTALILVKTVFPLFDFPENEYLSTSLLTNEAIILYVVDTLFALLVCISIVPFLKKRKSRSSNKIGSKVVFLSFLIGAFSGFIFYFFLFKTTSLVISTSVQVIDLELLPNLETLVFYISSSTFFAAIVYLFTTVYWYVLYTYKNEFWLNLFGLGVGMSFISALGFLVMSAEANLNWIVFITALLFLMILMFSIFLLKKTPSFLYSSKLRLLFFFSYLSGCFVYISYSSGDAIRQQDLMLQEGVIFSVDEENEIEQLTTDLLNSLESELRNVPANALRDVFSNRLVEDVLKPEWLRYTISIQLIDDMGDAFADYTTSLSPPQWSTDFRIQELEIPFEDEQIQRNNLRPVIRSRPINTINASYSSFRRGWIPLFENETSDEKTGWILCSIYKEIPQLNRPLRTVIYASNHSNSNQTLSATSFLNGVPIRSSITGIPLEIPGPGSLSSSLIQKVKSDSVFNTTSSYGGVEVVELYMKGAQDQIVRIATPKTNLTLHLFSFLRLFFTLVLLGVFSMILFSWKKDWHMFGHSRRFKDRLLDRSILASLLCLIFLVASSYYVLSNQNTEDVQERLLGQLERLTSNLENQSEVDISDGEALQSITSLLDIDASLYTNGILKTSTISQFFTQHLLPTTVPRNIYQKITQHGSSKELEIVMLDSQEMMIGYAPWFNQNNEIAGIAAIPTFLKAPKFYERLLSTTSYLVGFYTLIFGFLMLTIGFISSQLTSPLEALRDGLKKISDGDLETTLPVKSSDEIGALTSAYNKMGTKLKHVQEELAKTEREAAWKEMAQQVAHEIKNPLTPMKLNLQHLERQMESSDESISEVKPKIAKITNSMIEQIDSLNKIASDFSKFAKPIQEEFLPIDLNDLIQSVSELYASDTSFRLEVEAFGSTLTILGVKEELRRVLINLIKNAKEASKEESVVSISTFTDSIKEHAFIKVSDSGEGISEEDQKRIFVPNFSTKSSGTGLGLAISKKIIEEHNGEITFSSSIDSGTSFTIMIPLKTE